MHIGTKRIKQPKSRSEASSLHLLLTTLPIVLSCFSRSPDHFPHIIFLRSETKLCFFAPADLYPAHRRLSKITRAIRRMRKEIARCLLGDLLGVNSLGRCRFDLHRTRAEEKTFCSFYFEFSVHILF